MISREGNAKLQSRSLQFARVVHGVLDEELPGLIPGRTNLINDLF